MACSSGITIVVGIIGTKIIANLIGPSGLGVLGIFQGFIGVASTFIGCGLSRSAIREMASSPNIENKSIISESLLFGLILLGFFGAILAWCMRARFAQIMFGGDQYEYQVGLLGVGIFFAVVAGLPDAILQGMRRIGDIARLNVMSSIISASVAVIVLYLLKERGIVLVAISAPMVYLLFALYFANNLKKLSKLNEYKALQNQFVKLLGVGMPLMVATMIALGGQLAVRTYIVGNLGEAIGGYYQAAWTISMAYIGLLIGVMATDYFPRLTEVINKHEFARSIVDEQLEIVLLLSGPLLVCVVFAAPWIIPILYTEEFAPAAEILRWQALGDIFKVASFPIGFILAAAGRTVLTLIVETSWTALYVASVFFGVQHFGIAALGISFFIAYLIHFIVLSILAWGLIGYRINNRNFFYLIFITLSCISNIISFSLLEPPINIMVGSIFIIIVTFYSIFRMEKLLKLKSIIINNFKNFSK